MYEGLSFGVFNLLKDKFIELIVNSSATHTFVND